MQIRPLFLNAFVTSLMAYCVLVGPSHCAEVIKGGHGPNSPTQQSSSIPPAGYLLVWADEFNTDGLPDPSNWGYDTERNAIGWYNNEKQYYSNSRIENSNISNGSLKITARKEDLSRLPDFGGQAYSSARLFTSGKREFTYGFFEVRAKMPCGQGTWPAIWMLGNSGEWPYRGEIDILEHLGTNPLVFQSGVHVGAHFAGNAIMKSQKVGVACTYFHNYQLLWTPESMIFMLDGVAYHSYSNDGRNDPNTWPFNRPQFLLLNLAIGGDLGGAIDTSIFPRTLEVDYVRVYQNP